MSTERGLIIEELEAIVDYASMTEDGRAIILNAIRIIKEGDDLERAEKILDASERMLDKLREEYVAFLETKRLLEEGEEGNGIEQERMQGDCAEGESVPGD